MNDTEILVLAVMAGATAILVGMVFHENGRKVKWGYVARMTLTSTLFVLLNFLVIFFSTAWVYQGVTSDLAYALGMQPIICLWVSSSLFPNPFQGFDRAAVQALERVLPQRLLSKHKAT
jgi:hypothetical protein